MLLTILGEVIRKIADHSNPQNFYDQLAGTAENPDFGRIPSLMRRKVSEVPTVIQRQTAEFNNSTRNMIVITNARNCEKSMYGDEYKAKLDPRDQLLPHIFKFEVEINRESNIMESYGWETLCRQMQEFLVEVV